jgi:aspartokinase
MKEKIRGIAHREYESRITVHGASSSFLSQLHPISFDLFSYEDGALSFCIADEDKNHVIHLIKEYKYALTEHLSKISIIGYGIRSNHEISSLIFDTLKGYTIHMMSLSELKMTILVDRCHLRYILCILHDMFLGDKIDKIA